MDQKRYELDQNYRIGYDEGQRIGLNAIKTMIDLMRAGRAVDEVMNSVDDIPHYLKSMLYNYLQDYLQREREDGQNN